MASGVAHDVNNALSPIVAYAELLSTIHPDLPAASLNYLRLIKRSGEDIGHIVSRMREFYRRRSDSELLAPVDINQIVHEVIELTRPRWRDISQRAGISIQIREELAPGLPLLSSDPAEFREALINLVFNAVDALGQGGTITLATRVKATSGGEKNGADGQQLQVEVRDNGVGMDEKTRQRCLEPFFSTKSLRGGTGLGLAMVYGMMQRHEGNIEIESSLGYGTCVRLTFPVPEKTPLAGREKSPAAGQKHGLHILCIDDDEPIRLLLKDCLTAFHHSVATAANGEQGLEFFRVARQTKQPFDIIITDLGMPQMDGHQLARIIKAESPQTPIVMMTGWGAMMREDGESAPEVDVVVGKPPKIQELNELLIRLAMADKSLAENVAALAGAEKVKANGMDLNKAKVPVESGA
jgi:CheY-like chemotaxis protein